MGCVALKSGDQLPDEGGLDSTQVTANEGGDVTAAASPDAAVTDQDATADQDAVVGQNSFADADAAPTNQDATVGLGTVVDQDATLDADADDQDAWSFITREAGARTPDTVWVSIPGCASAIASGWMIGCDHKSLFEWDPVAVAWEQVPGVSAYKVTVDLNGIPWAIRPDGQILKWNGSAFAPFGISADGGTLCALDVASGSSDEETWALECGGGAILHWTGTAWSAVPGAGVKIAVSSAIDPACNAHVPMVIGTNQILFYYWCAANGFVANLIDPSSVTVMFANDLSTDFILDTLGQINQWSGFPTDVNAPPWSPFVPAPGGNSSRFGAWGGWIFAMSLDTGDMAMIAP